MNGLVTTEHRGWVVVLRLQLPGPLESVAQPLADAIERLGHDATWRVLVLDCSDGLRSESLRPVPVATAAGASTLPALLATLRQPTIACLGGDCVDGGLEVALACDLRVAAPEARLGMRHVRHGALPSDGGTQRLARLVGRAHALRLLLTGDLVDGHEAVRIGLAQATGGMPDALALAERVAMAAPIATEYVKEAVLAGMDLSLSQGLRLEADLSFLLHTTEDRAEGLRSFRERTPPEYHGR